MLKRIASLLFSCASTPALAGNLHLLEPKDVYLEYYKYTSMHDPYLYPIDREIYQGASFNTDFNIIRYKDFLIYWKNNLHFDQSRVSGHIKHAGWQYEIGLPLLMAKDSTKIELFKQHHSRHVLEETRSTHFPVYDRYGVRFRLYP